MKFKTLKMRYIKFERTVKAYLAQIALKNEDRLATIKLRQAS